MIDTGPWSSLSLVERVAEGNRNEVWRAELAGRPVAVRRSRRTAASLAWELALVSYLSERDFAVPQVCATDTGEKSSADGVVVQSWLEGTPPDSAADWDLVGEELERLHRETTGYAQRPGCCSVTELHFVRRSVDADLDAMPPAVRTDVLRVFRDHLRTPTAAIHGDVDPSNIRISTDGRVGLLDWDESRVDLTWHDLSVLRAGPLSLEDSYRAQRLSHAWETANAWLAEPQYAKKRLAALRALD